MMGKAVPSNRIALEFEIERWKGSLKLLLVRAIGRRLRS